VVKMTKSFKCIKDVDGSLWSVFIKEAEVRKLRASAFFEEIVKFYFKHNPLLYKDGKNEK